MSYLLKFAALIILLSSCNTYKTKYPYSLDDFKPELRKHLEKIVQYGGSCNDDDNSAYHYLTEIVSPSELQKLTLSEHPILRAFAFKALCWKSSSRKRPVNVDELNDSSFYNESRKNSEVIDKILMNHLDDTAIITWCKGEWGNDYIYVSDYYLKMCENQTKILKADLEKEVIENHNYLNHAYEYIGYAKNGNEKNYPIIKAMVLRNNAWTKGYRYSILATLSNYKKPEDVTLIAEKLPHFSKWNSYNTFYIVEQNPDTAYFKFLYQFYVMVKKIKTNKEFAIPYNSSYEFKEKYLSFLSALAAYKNKQSLDLFTEILYKKIYPDTDITEAELKWQIYKTLKKYECLSFKNLIQSLKTSALEYERKSILKLDNPPLVYTESKFW